MDDSLFFAREKHRFPSLGKIPDSLAKSNTWALLLAAPSHTRRSNEAHFLWWRAPLGLAFTAPEERERSEGLPTKRHALFLRSHLFSASASLRKNHNKLHRTFCSSQRMPIYKVSMEEARWGAVFPGKFVPVLTFEGKCSGFRAKTAHISGHLPRGSTSSTIASNPARGADGVAHDPLSLASTDARRNPWTASYVDEV